MKLENVNIGYENATIIQSVNLEIKESEIFVLMGPSGSGKSTLLKGIAGLIPISSGKIDFEDVNQSIGIVFQEPRLFPHMNVMDNLAFGLRAKGYSKNDRYALVRDYLTLLQLQGLEDRFPHELSGGQQQRVSLGRAIILNPNILLLDEPFSSLDTPLRIELTEWLYRLQKEKGFSILWVTHYIDEAFSVADQIGVIMEGKIKQIGKPIDVYRNPNSEEMAAFFSLPNRFSLQIWKGLFPHISNHTKYEMGWIPQDALIIQHQNSSNIEDPSLEWIEGKVQRIKHEITGQKIIIEGNGQTWELIINHSQNIPQINDNIKMGVPYDKIIWYPK